MNDTCLSGVLITDPKKKYINCVDLSTSVCRCIIGENNDFFHIIAFDEKADFLSSHFQKGVKVIFKGKFKNHIFEDGNMTKHFTNVFLVDYIERADVNLCSNALSGKIRIQDHQRDELYYDKMCDLGYLAIDENDYFEISNKT